jgi:hypothetical protein
MLCIQPRPVAFLLGLGSQNENFAKTISGNINNFDAIVFHTFDFYHNTEIPDQASLL